MKIKLLSNGKIYKVLCDRGEFYEVEGLFLGVPILVAKDDCIKITEGNND